jgi:hypothetical protein
MENSKIKVTYECHSCGARMDQVEEEHADAKQKFIPHNKPTISGVVVSCSGQSLPVHLEVEEC